MNSCISSTGTISQFGGIGFLSAVMIGWDLLLWLFVAVPWPAPLTIILLLKFFGFVPTVRKMRAHLCMAQLPEPEDRSVTLGLVLISWPLSRVLRYWRRVGQGDTRLAVAIGMVESAKAAAQISQWKTKCTGTRT